MKMLLVCLFMYLTLAGSKIIPDDLPQFCPKNYPTYNDCTTSVLLRLGPHLKNGVPAIQFPSLNPLKIPLFTVDRSFSIFLKFNMVIKDIEMWGFDAATLKNFKFDPDKKQGELDLNAPFLQATYEYKMDGRMGTVVLDSEASSHGNFTNVDFHFKFSLMPVERMGVQYYTFKDFKVTSTMDDFAFKIKSKDPKYQPITDVIQNTITIHNPLIVIGHPMYEEAVTKFFQELLEHTLSAIPAEELIPSK